MQAEPRYFWRTFTGRRVKGVCRMRLQTRDRAVWRSSISSGVSGRSFVAEFLPGHGLALGVDGRVEDGEHPLERAADSTFDRPLLTACLNSVGGLGQRFDVEQSHRGGVEPPVEGVGNLGAEDSFVVDGGQQESDDERAVAEDGRTARLGLALRLRDAVLDELHDPRVAYGVEHAVNVTVGELGEELLVDRVRGIRSDSPGTVERGDALDRADVGHEVQERPGRELLPQRTTGLGGVNLLLRSLLLGLLCWGFLGTVPR